MLDEPHQLPNKLGFLPYMYLKKLHNLWNPPMNHRTNKRIGKVIKVLSEGQIIFKTTKIDK